MRIHRDAIGNISIDQSRYAINIAKKFLGESDSHKPVKRPLPADFVASKEDCAQSEEEVSVLENEYRLNYSSALGSLIYLLNTRPDICFAVIKLAKFMTKPGRKHFQAMIHLLHFISMSAF